MNIYLTEKLKNYYHQNGFIKTFFWTIEKFFKNLILSLLHFRTCYFIEKNLSNELPNIKPKIDVIYKVLSLKDLHSLRVLVNSRKYKFFKERLSRGQTCIVCYHDNRPIGYKWISFIPETDKHLGLTVKPLQDESYGFDLYVLPEYRAYNIGYALISYWLNFSRESGKIKAIGVVAKTNTPMLMATKVVFGFKITKQFRCLEIFHWRGFIITTES